MSGFGSVLPKLCSGDDEQHSHTVQFYVEDSFLIDGLGRFVAPVLLGSEAAVIVATPDDTCLELAREPDGARRQMPSAVGPRGAVCRARCREHASPCLY